MAYTYGEYGTVKLGSGSTSSYYQCRLGYQVNSQSIEDNTSNITLRLEVRSINSSYATCGYKQTTTIDGTALSSKTFDMSDTNTWQVFGERTITITHNSDGTYSANKSGSFTTTASGTYSLKSGSASVTVAPATIPRASQPSLITWPDTTQNVTIGDTITIHMNRASDSFKHTVRYAWGDKSGVIANDVDVNCGWTIPMEFCDNISSSTSGTGTVYVDTYSNGSLVGTKSVNFTGYIPDWVVPSIGDISLSEANSNVSPLGVLVQGKSSLNVNINTWGAYSSWITSCRVDGIDSNTYWATSFTSAPLQIAGTRTITVTVTDSRGRTSQKQVSYNCVAYSNPSISVATVRRCNSDGTENEEGTFAKYSFRGAIASIDNKNSKEFKLGYKKNTDSDYTYITLDNSNYELYANDVIIGGIEFSVDYSYDFQFLVSDYFTSSSIIGSLGTGFTLLDFNASGKGMGIGKVSEKNALEVALPTEFSNTVNGVDIERYVKFRDGIYDANQCLMNGCYRVDPNTINLPPVDEEWKKYGILIVEVTDTVWTADNGAAWIWQTFKGTSGEIWTRRAVNETTFTEWQKFTAHIAEWSARTAFADETARIQSRGDIVAQTDGTKIDWPGLSMSTCYNHTGSFPGQFGNVLNLQGAGSSQLLMEWLGYTETGNLWYRSLRDVTDDGTTWGPWYMIPLIRAVNMVANTPGNSSHIRIGDLKLCWGKVNITPTANTPTATWVTFPISFSGQPAVFTNAHSEVPGSQVISTSAADIQTSGFAAYIYRTNTTETSIIWFAIGI